MNAQKPNIVFFFTDDQRFDTIQALGNDEISTPNLDKLVKCGTTFTHAHIPCGTSGAVCMPSRAMLNSGRKLFSIENAGQEIPAEHTTIGEAFQANGYDSFGTGKWHNGRNAFARSFNCGGEIFFGGMFDHWNVPAYDYDPAGKYDNICPRIPNPSSSNETIDQQCDHITAGKHSSELLSECAIDFINKRDSDKPFYMYVSLMAPHDPRSMPEKFKKMYDPEKIKLPENFMGGHPFDTGALNIRDEMLAAFPRRPEETKRHIAEYYGMISHLDHQFGLLVKALEDKGILDNTIIVFAGDNGLALGRHGLFGKQNCYEHSVRVPLIFSGPGIPKDVRTEANAYLFDIFPTLCELTGIQRPDTVEGSSLTEAFTNPDEKIRDTMYFAYCEFQRAVKKDGYKLVEYVFEGKHIATQLFDLKNDPLELNNLAKSEANAEKVGEMRKELCKLRDEWNDQESHWGKIFWDSCKL
jgi:arylsulfatase A-like enzyme